MLARLSKFLAPLLATTPPSLDAPDRGDIWELLKTGRRFRALGKKDGYRLLRWGPMAVADLVAEWFETDLLQACIAARGIFGSAQGPRSAGTAALLLLNAAIDPAPGGSSVTVKGGPGALTAAMADAAREAGAEIRVNSGVSRILVRDGRVAAVLLEDGTRDCRDGSHLERRPAANAAEPRRSGRSRSGVPDENPELSVSRDHGARSTSRCRALPAFTGITSADDLRTSSRRSRASTTSNGHSTRRSTARSRRSPTSMLRSQRSPIRRSRLPGKHVLSVCVQFAPYRLAART